LKIEPLMGHEDESTRVSIIVPVLNEERRLPQLFDSIRGQTLPGNVTLSDLVVIDNGSVDASPSVAQRLGASVLVRPDDSIGEMRNVGARQSTGDIFVFADADCVLEKDAIGVVVTCLKDEKVAAVGPDGLIPIGAATWVQRAWYNHTRQLDRAETTRVQALSSGFLAVRASDFCRVNGFSSALTIGEDTDLSRRLTDQGMALLKTSALRIYNSGHPATLARFIRREFWHGDSLGHILVHKRLDLLTAYFLANLAGLMVSAAASVVFRSILPLAGYLLASSLLPLAKALKKTHKPSLLTAQLFLLYVLYLHTRSASLLKLR
jgi:glycosyltransferase involved in cell wall biosynthesis